MLPSCAIDTRRLLVSVLAVAERRALQRPMSTTSHALARGVLGVGGGQPAAHIMGGGVAACVAGGVAGVAVRKASGRVGDAVEAVAGGGRGVGAGAGPPTGLGVAGVMMKRIRASSSHASAQTL